MSRAAGARDRAGATRQEAGVTRAKTGVTRAETGATQRAAGSGAALALILAAVVVRHATCLRAPFFADDYLFLDQVRGRTLLAALMSKDPIGNFLRPVSRPLYFSVVGGLGGESPVLFHAVNLLLFLGSVTLLFWIARRLAGDRAALVAAAVLGLSYAADVPLLWCSGSQDLLALGFALATIALTLAGKRMGAAVALGLGLLSKETVALTPLIAMLLSARRGESLGAILRRNAPLLAIAGAWAVLWLTTAASRPAAATVMQADPAALPATLLHLIQTSFGLEWALPLPPLDAVAIPLGAVGIGAIAVAFAAWRRVPNAPVMASPRLAPWLGGAWWALLGALPIAAVASIWSAYFFLFALCGAALALGAIAARLPRWGAIAVVALLGSSSALASVIPTFSMTRDTWSRQSHVNRAYVLRATEMSSHFLVELRRLHPTFPTRSTIYFADLPAYSGFQVGNGALLRWAYRDATLSSYYVSAFTIEQSRRGPCFFLVANAEGLKDRSNDVLAQRGLVYSMVLNMKPRAAAGLLTLLLEREPGDREGRYWLAWNEWLIGDTLAAQRSLTEAGFTPARGAAGLVTEARARLARGDTHGALGALFEARELAALDVDPHLEIADLWLRQPDLVPAAVVEAFAATTLAPQRPEGWRLLAMGQMKEDQIGPASISLREYFKWGGASAESDTEARAMLRSVEAIMAGRATPDLTR